MARELAVLSCADTARGVAAGDWTATEVVDATLARIEARDPAIGAFLTTYADAARLRARQIDDDAGLRALPLAGVPIALKDNLCVAGHEK